MLLQRTFANRLQIRRTHLDRCMKAGRERHELKEELKSWLGCYPKCILTSGFREELGHANNMECE